MKTFAISDIHGCFQEFELLLAKLPIDLKEDRLVILGDMIDRGPDTKQLLDKLIDMQQEFGEDHVVVLYGNHEDLMLDTLMYQGRKYHSFDLWWKQGGKQTAWSYLPEEFKKEALTEEEKYKRAIMKPEHFIDPAHIQWLASRPWYFEDDDYIFVHGGLRPDMTPEQMRNSPIYQQDLLWIRWEFIHSPFDWGKKVIFGHTADNHTGKFEPIVMENKIGIDTAVCPPSSNALTAVELPAEKFYFQESVSTSDY